MAPIDLHDCCPCRHQGKNDSPCHFDECVIAVAYFCGLAAGSSTPDIIMPTAVACKYADAAMMSGFIIHGDITILQIDNVVHFVRLSPLFLVFSAISNGVSTERIVRADGWQELPWLAYKTIYCSDNAS
ncbi:hypothetical protein [Bifidobacterium asteroides]|uniref:hypothetical protein n=1 Tax=Bifidobacterium asteroides TaxID=1684 RepID=UPI0011B71E14|nr:hypothetical protein [Bifidobacterium asteroides]